MRKNLRNKMILSAFLVFLPLFLHAKGGAAGSVFLCSLQDAKPEAFAGAYIANASGIEAALTNPAGLATVSGVQISLSHYIGLFDQSTESFSIAVPLNFAVFAFTGSFNYTSNFIEVDEFGDKLSPVANYDYMVSFSVGKALENWLMAGLTFKHFGSFLYAYSRTGWAFDLGVSAKNGIFRFGAALQNLGRQTAFIDLIEPLPSIIKTGAGVSVSVNSTDSLNAEACYNIPLTNEERYVSAGMEYKAGSAASIRSGVRLYEESPVALYAGAGFRYDHYTLNYTISLFQDTGNSHKISLIVSF